MTSNAELFSAAQAVIPGGVDSPVRAYGSVGGVPRFIEKAQGPWIWDAEGTRYVDLVCTWGPALLGACPSRGRLCGSGGRVEGAVLWRPDPHRNRTSGCHHRADGSGREGAFRLDRH